MKKAIIGTLFALLSMGAAHPIVDGGYRSGLLNKTTAKTIASVERNITTSSRRRAVAPGNPDIVAPYVAQGESMRWSITNPTQNDCIITFSDDSKSYPFPIKQWIPPGDTWVTEDFASDFGVSQGAWRLSATCPVVVNGKIGHYAFDPAGFYGHTPIFWKSNQVLKEIEGIASFQYPAADLPNMVVNLEMRSFDDADIGIRPTTIQSRPNEFPTAGIPEPDFKLPTGKYGVGEDLAKDNFNGAVTGTPFAPLFGTGTSGHAHGFRKIPNGDEFYHGQVLGETVISHKERNNDSYALQPQDTAVDWAVILGVANNAPGKSVNVPDAMAYTTIPSFIFPGGKAMTTVTAVTHTEGNASQDIIALAGRRIGVPLQQPAGTYSALELLCIDKFPCIMPYAETNLFDAKGLVSVERNIIGTAQDLITPNSTGYATMIGEYTGARTEFDIYARDASDVRLEFFDDLGNYFGQKTLSLKTGEYQRLKLADMVCGEIIYGSARMLVLNGAVLGGFSRIDNGGGDKVVGKFEPRPWKSAPYDGPIYAAPCAQ